MVGGLGFSGAPDVIVIGGGVIGCSVALRLAQARLKVMVMDPSEPGAEASSAAAGMLAPQGEMVEHDSFFDLCAASRDLYPEFVAEVEGLSGTSVGYRRDGTLLVAVDEDECRKLEEAFASQSRMGLPLERLEARTVGERVAGLSPRIRCGLFVPGDHWLDNERLCRALAESCARRGVVFRRGDGARKINAQGQRVKTVEGDSGSVFSAAKFILAAGCWSAALVAPLGISLPMQPCRGQMIEFECDRELPLVVRAGHHYLVPRSAGRILAGTTVEYEGFEKPVTGEGLISILEATSRFAPLVKSLRFLRAWAGLRPDTADHKPILGLGDLENLIFATGHFRNGILLAPITAKLISEVVLTGKPAGGTEAYHPARFARKRA